MTRARVAGAGLVALACAVALAAEGVKLRPLPAITTDDAGATLLRPEGVGCGPGPTLLVADSGHGRLVRYALGEVEAQAAPAIALPPNFFPLRAETLSTGEIVALDGRTRRIARLAADGRFLGWLDPQAAGASGPAIPQSIHVDRRDRVFVLDARGARILVLDAAGKLERSIAFPAEYGFFADLTTDTQGSVYAVDAVGRQVYAARPDAAVLTPLGGNLAADLEFPTGIAVDARARIFLADRNGGGIVALGPDGAFRGRQSGRGWKEGLLRHPSHLCLTSGVLFVADRDNNRVQAFAVAD